MKKLFTIFALSTLIVLVLPTNALAQSFDNYVNTLPQTVPITAATEPAQEHLEEVISEVVSLGHLAPTIYFRGADSQAEVYYFSPSETIHVLSRAYPYVSSGLQAQLKTYLDNEIAAYPPHSTTRYAYTGGNVNSWQGARREYFPIDPDLRYNVWPGPELHPSVLYSIWAYSYYTNDWTYAQNNYAALKTIFQDLQTNGIDDYGDISAAIGFARIADHMNNSADKSAAMTLLNNNFSAATNFNQFLATSEAKWPEGVHDFYPYMFRTTGKALAFHLDPDVGRFLKDYASTDALAYADYICRLVPLCWLTAPGQSHGENTFTVPVTGWTYFHIQAYVNGLSTQELQKMIDFPDRKGDLYYIQKLVTAIEAPSDGSSTPTPNPSPVACQNTDINQDGIVDLSDYSALVAEFFSTNPSDPRADINQDGIVDLSDYSLLVSDFFETTNCGS